MLVSQNVLTFVRNACFINNQKANSQHAKMDNPLFRILKYVFLFSFFFSCRFQDDLEIDIGYLLVTLTAY